MPRSKITQPKRLMLVALVVVLGWLVQQAGIDLSALTRDARSSGASRTSSAVKTSSVPAEGASDALERINRAAANRESGVMVTVDARVEKTLSDDLDGSRHQRFLIELEDRRILLVAHNIDLADRVSLRENDRVRVRGQYEWNARGGVLHWTHHDPAGRHPGGFIEHEGRRIE